MGSIFSAKELAAACGGIWNTAEDFTVCGIETDTRRDLQNKLFVALKGERFDAHDFLAEAAGKGAVLCVAEDRSESIPAGAKALIVKDTLTAYQQISRHHRLRMQNLKIAAVTGSVGKTSVKEMISAILRRAAGAANVVSTTGNTNNHIGVPQNLLRFEDNTKFAVIEMGTSSPGEIAVLSELAVPDVAVVNTVAPCHLEKLIDLEGVAREKGDIFKFLKPGGTAVIPCDIAETPLLEAASCNFKRITFGAYESSADVRSRFVSGNLEGSSFELLIADKSFPVSWQLTGKHQCRNASAAAAVALAMGIAPEVIASGLADTSLPGMRGKIIKYNGAVILNDAYNASPASMSAVLKMFAESVICGKVVLLLGTMLELGGSSQVEHENILKLARELFPQGIVITVGSGFEGLGGADHHFAKSSEAADTVEKLCVEGTSILVKGSRGTALELALPQERDS